tara:strand:- start:992 stop:1192 length:201 start_codon:yes stop_codon:yes gene_type:complete
MTQYTVYKVVYAEDEGDAIETALDMMTDFETASGKIVIEQEQDCKTPVIDTSKFLVMNFYDKKQEN